MARGDLQSYLEDSPVADDRWTSARPGSALAIARDLARALAYLHGWTHHATGTVLVHGALQSRHVLLNDELCAKLSDIGHARGRAGDSTRLPHRSTSQPQSSSSRRWVAPELLLGRNTVTRPTPAMDVYAFGVVLLELDTHDLPFAHVMESHPEMTEASLERRILEREIHPSIESLLCPRAIRQIVRQCTAFEPSERLTMGEVVAQLEELTASAQQDAQADDEPRRNRTREGSLSMAMERLPTVDDDSSRSGWGGMAMLSATATHTTWRSTASCTGTSLSTSRAGFFVDEEEQ